MGMAGEHHLLLDGAWTRGEGETRPVMDKYRLSPFASITTASVGQVRAMVDAAHEAFRRGAPIAYERGQGARAGVRARRGAAGRFRRDDAGRSGIHGGGRERRGHAVRADPQALRRGGTSAWPARWCPSRAHRTRRGRFAFTLRVPLGVVAAITPFNSPLNTVTHKIGPAFAAGNAVVLKPSSSTPLTACKLAEVLLEAGLPRGFLSVLHASTETVRHLLDDPRVRFFAFTGSTEVGEAIQRAAGLRRTQMELGSIAFTIVCDDADLDRALPKIAGAGYRKAGQVCTSIQMLLVQERLFETVRDRLVPMVEALKFGDPRADGTTVGPLIAEREAERVETWIDEAVSKGATRLAGGGRSGAVLPPTLLSGVGPSMRVGCCGDLRAGRLPRPVRHARRRDRARQRDALRACDRHLHEPARRRLQAARRLEVGGVHINETSSSRVDLMPYGGSKDSGLRPRRTAIRDTRNDRGADRLDNDLRRLPLESEHQNRGTTTWQRKSR